MSDRPSARPVSLLEGVLTTAAVPVLYLLALRVPLAYVDEGALARSRAELSPFAAGLAPFMTAYGLVELAALLVPRWRRARHDARGRFWLERLAGVLAVGIALVQAYGIARSLESLDLLTKPGLLPVLVDTATIAAGSCLLAIAARWTTRRGLVNGYVLWWTLPVVIDLLGGQALRSAAIRGGAQDVVLLAVVFATAAAATCVAVAGGDSPAVAPRVEGSAYRGDKADAPRASLPVPVSSIQPIAAASAVLMFPAVLANLHVGWARSLQSVLQRGDVVFGVAYAVLIAAFALLAAALMHRPAEMADFVRRLGSIDEPTAQADARAALRSALPPTFAYLAAVVLASQAAGGLARGVPAGVMIALATAGVVDLVRSLLAHVRTRDLVCVAEERDAYGVAALRAALAREGIDARPRGMAALSLLQAFGPYAPVELYVREADAERASGLLRHWAAGEAKPVATPAAVTAGTRVPWKPLPRAAVLGVLGAMSLVVILGPRASSDTSTPHPRAEIALVRVDEDADPLAVAAHEDTPEGVGIYQEVVPLGLDAGGQRRSARRYYARVVPRAGESNEAAWKRTLPWLQRFELPAGDRWAWEAVTEPRENDDGSRTFVEVGLRTLVLGGEPVVTTRDVKDAEVYVDEQLGFSQASVLVTLGTEGADRFHEATREWVNRRLAIVVDGHVDSAPVIRSPIAGGHVTITMGAGAMDKQLAEARSLAASLR